MEEKYTTAITAQRRSRRVEIWGGIYEYMKGFIHMRVKLVEKDSQIKVIAGNMQWYTCK